MFDFMFAFRYSFFDEVARTFEVFVYFNVNRILIEFESEKK